MFQTTKRTQMKLSNLQINMKPSTNFSAPLRQHRTKELCPLPHTFYSPLLPTHEYNPFSRLSTLYIYMHATHLLRSLHTCENNNNNSTHSLHLLHPSTSSSPSSSSSSLLMNKYRLLNTGSTPRTRLWGMGSVGGVS